MMPAHYPNRTKLTLVAALVAATLSTAQASELEDRVTRIESLMQSQGLMDMLTQLQPSAADLCPESEQVNTIIALLVANLAKKLTDLNVPIEFFPELPLKAMLQGFIGIDLPAGELPAQAELLMGWALGDE